MATSPEVDIRTRLGAAGAKFANLACANARSLAKSRGKTEKGGADTASHASGSGWTTSGRRSCVTGAELRVTVPPVITIWAMRRRASGGARAVRRVWTGAFAKGRDSDIDCVCARAPSEA